MEETAYHEAGHAFMATYLGGTVHSLTIEPDRDDGPVRFGDARIVWQNGKMATKVLQVKLVSVALAGPVAEMIYRGEPLHPGFVAEWKDDWEQAWEAAELLAPKERTRLKFLEETSQVLWWQLRRDENWAAIAALADNLLAHETLEEEEIRDILTAWMR
jgi:ATP-dependent Zn protease